MEQREEILEATEQREEILGATEQREEILGATDSDGPNQTDSLMAEVLDLLEKNRQSAVKAVGDRVRLDFNLISF